VIAMTAVTASEARTRFSELISLVGVAKERVVIERHQRPIAALVSIEEMQLLDDLLDAAREDTAVQERLAKIRATRQHKNAVDMLVWPGAQVALTPKSFADVVDQVRYPRPATSALKDLMAADGD
jgi:PHD/YefM family antitoxin component YafN of YafNO toxin-antitoxin module